MTASPPPPPYSETDVFSSSGIRTPSTSVPSSQYEAPLESPSRELPDHSEGAFSSTTGTVIYTPPHTPDASIHGSNFIEEADPISHASSSAYFDSRPMMNQPASFLLIHDLTICSTTTFADLPYPSPEKPWLEREITERDWATFVNHLLPRHADASNAMVADRKLQAELVDEQMQNLTLSQEHRSKKNVDEVKAQLSPLRTATSTNKWDTQWQESERALDDWNTGFFEPRNCRVNVNISQPMHAEASPTATDSSFVNDDLPRRRSGFGGMLAKFVPRVSADERGFRLGSIVANGKGFRMGDFIVANGQGFSMGGLHGIVASSDGSFMMGGPNGIVADRQGFRIRGHSYDQHPGAFQNPEASGSRTTQTRDTGEARVANTYSSSHGQPVNNKPNRARSGSVSSVTSVSSASSTISSESVGSLLDNDKIPDYQLPMAEASLRACLNDPSHPINKATITHFNSSMTSSRGNPPTSQLSKQDLITLRREVRGLARQFKELKRSQKAERRVEKRERRARRKAEKRERRAVKREMRRTRRACKKGKGRLAQAASPWMANRNVGLPFQRAQALEREGFGADRLEIEITSMQVDIQNMQASVEQLRGQAHGAHTGEKGRSRLLIAAEELEDKVRDLIVEKEKLETQCKGFNINTEHARSPSGEQESGVVPKPYQ
jgi:hypothetical protein